MVTTEAMETPVKGLPWQDPRRSQSSRSRVGNFAPDERLGDRLATTALEAIAGAR